MTFNRHKLMLTAETSRTPTPACDTPARGWVAIVVMAAAIVAALMS